MADILRLICSACDTPFVSNQRGGPLPICGRCHAKMNKLCAMPLKKLSSEENEALARSMVQMGKRLRANADRLGVTIHA